MKITRDSLLTLEAYAKTRQEFRARVLAHKRARTVHLGEHVTLVFEDELTLRYQVQEMLRIEKTFEEAGIQDELDAYNPLVPDGSNFKATMLIEYEDVDERRAALAQLKGIEDRVYVQVEGCPKVWAIADEDLPRENDVKTSAVHFLRFELTTDMVVAAKNGVALGIGVDHPNYRAEIPAVGADTRKALMADLGLIPDGSRIVKRILLAVLAALLSPIAAGAEVRVLSAGAVEPGLHAFADVAKRETGHTLTIQFNTGPQIAKRLADREVYDILLSPPPAIAQALKDGQIVADTRTPVGRVGAGIVVRAAANAPDVATVDALKRALLSADSIVYNTASTGLYLDGLFARLGIADALKPKTTRYPDGASVMEHVIRGKGNEIGFGAITEIRIFEPKGLKFVGPLPADVQNYTSYEAAVMSAAGNPEAARAVLQTLSSPTGKAAFVKGGVE